MVFEGQEKENFWNVLGGKKEYVNDKRLQVSAMLVMGRIEPTESIKLLNSSIICKILNNAQVVLKIGISLGHLYLKNHENSLALDAKISGLLWYLCFK